MVEVAPRFLRWEQEDAPLSPQQAAFYGRFRGAVLAGEPIDVGESDGYHHLLTSECVATFSRDPEMALEMIAKVRAAPLSKHATSYAGISEGEMRLLRGEWKAGYELVRERDKLPLLLGMAEELDHPRLESFQVWRMARNNITKVGFSVGNQIFEELQRVLDEFHDAHGISIVESFWQRLHRPGVPVAEVAEEIRGDVGPHLSFDDVVYFVELGQANPSDGYLIAFEKFPGYERLIPTPRALAFHGWYGLVWEEFIRALVRSAENRARASANLPGVGKGWVSEVRLLNQLREAFPAETVHHQVRPYWLGRQSLDIVFADRNVAVEYQGAQHSRPVEFFGGEGTFATQQQRDAAKRALCEENGMALIEVHPDYVLADVIAEVKAALDAATRTEIAQ